MHHTTSETTIASPHTQINFLVTTLIVSRSVFLQFTISIFLNKPSIQGTKKQTSHLLTWQNLFEIGEVGEGGRNFTPRTLQQLSLHWSKQYYILNSEVYHQTVNFSDTACFWNRTKGGLQLTFTSSVYYAAEDDQQVDGPRTTCSRLACWVGLVPSIATPIPNLELHLTLEIIET
jgi:hypothetical protein